MITASLYSVRSELNVSIPAADASVMQAGDVVTVSFMLPDDAEVIGKFERLADGGAVTLYRNTVWIKFNVLRREFFVLDYDSRHGAQSVTVMVEPASMKAYEAAKLAQRFKGVAAPAAT